MIKIVEALSDTNIGGAGILLLNRLKHTPRTHIFTVVVLPRGSKLTGLFRNIGIKVLEIDGCSDSSLDTKGYFAFKKIFNKFKPHLVNCHGCLSARLAAWSCGVPVKLYTRHCVYSVSSVYKYPSVRFLVGMATDIITDGIIAVAEAAKKNLLDIGISQNKIKVIINGAEPFKRIDKSEADALRKKYGIRAADKVITICARLEPCKDHATFLRAGALLCRGSRKYKFFVVGDGSEAENLALLAKKLGIAKKVIFTGFLKDVAPIMNITHINVNCSVGTETSSLALSEGMSLGIPMVVSDYGGNPYMVRSGENGYVYKAGDYAELAKNIEYLTTHPEVYSRMSYNSRLRFEQELNAKAMTENTLEYYMTLLYKSKSKIPKA